jgi:hypothetical protein
VHLRRALLLFAIVLGLAAVAASVSRPRDESEPEPPATTAPESQAAEPQPEPGANQTELFFDAAAPRAQGMDAGQAATIYVAVPRPGQVAIVDLGLGTTAEPLTAARFDVLPSRTGRFPITFVPAGGERPEEAGTLVVRE